MFIKKKDHELLVSQVYVDDIIFGEQLDSTILTFVEKVKIEFKMSIVGKLTFFFRFQIHQCESKSFLTQEKYAQKLIKKFALDRAKAKRTPVATHLKVLKDNSGKNVDESLYRSIIGSLLNLIASRPNCSSGVGVSARYKVYPRESHL